MSKKNYTPPHAIDLEQVVLGALMIDTKAADEVMLMLKNPKVFYDPRHQAIFTAISFLYGQNQAIDLITVGTQLRAMDKLESCGGDFYLIELTKRIASSAHIEHHSRLLLQFWIRRQLISDAHRIRAKAYDEQEDVFDVLHSAGLLLDAIGEQVSVQVRETTMEEALEAIGKRIEILSNKTEHEVTGIPTGFQKVNRFTGGWQPSDLIIIAARPGMGKTALVLNNILECVKQGIPCGIFSLEMSVHQLVTRLVACNSHFHLNQLFKHGFDKSEYFTTYLELEEQMKDYPIHFDEHSTDIRDIYTKARLWKRKYDIQLLVVDYIQLASDKTKKSHREQEISSITRNLKQLAKELNIPVIALSQLNREVENRNDKRPKLSDLRESGAIEQDADIIAFIYRPEYYGLPIPEDMEGNTHLIFAKYRNGSLSHLDLYFDKNKTKFTDPPQTRMEFDPSGSDPEGNVPF
ncbi:MAG: replicative DNA helicase [Bacteroidota bacterium]